MDRAEKESLLLEHASLIRRVARKASRKFPALAEDCEQEAMLACWRAIDRFDGARSSLRTFLSRRANGATRDYIRQRASIFGDYRRIVHHGVRLVFSLSATAITDDSGRRIPFHAVLPDTATLPVPSAGQPLAEELIRLASKSDRSILAAYWIEGLLIRQIGENLGVSESRAWQLVSSATRRLVNQLVLAGIAPADRIRKQEAQRGAQCDGADETA